MPTSPFQVKLELLIEYANGPKTFDFSSEGQTTLSFRIYPYPQSDLQDGDINNLLDRALAIIGAMKPAAYAEIQRRLRAAEKKGQ